MGNCGAGEWMSTVKMHADEFEIDAALVARLVAGQFPQWAHLPLEPVPSAGTVNALYRLGDQMVVRLPRVEAWVEDVAMLQHWLPRFAPHLPLAIPVPLAKGEPAAGYPWIWSIYTWLDGQEVTIDRIADPRHAAVALGEFVTALRRIDPAGGPPSFRGGTLLARDSHARASIAALDGVIDTGAATAAWESALQAPEWDGPPVWVHGDLLPGNMLAVDGRLSAIIDFGGVGVGDPACDVMVAWSLLPAGVRSVFRSGAHIDDATWERGRGWALLVALMALPYYLDTNPAFVRLSRHMIKEVLADLGR